MRKEAHRSSREPSNTSASLRQPQPPPRLRHQTVTLPQDDIFVADGDNTRVIVWGESGDGEDDETPEQIQEATPSPTQTNGIPFRIDDEMERRERELFGTKDRQKRNRTVFVVVPDRKAETLIPIIRKYVRPNSIIFSDKWAAYIGLGDEYKHYTVTHKYRFVKYHFLEERKVLKVTTNHIERLWVEPRRILRGLTCDELHLKLAQVPCRLMRTTPGKHADNIAQFFNDMVKTNSFIAQRGGLCAFVPVIPALGQSQIE